MPRQCEKPENRIGKTNIVPTPYFLSAFVWELGSTRICFMTIKILIISLFLSGFGGAYAQKSIDLIFKYNGFTDDPYKLSFIASNLSSNGGEEAIAKLSAYYVQNEKEILYSFDCNTFLQYINEIAKAKEERKQQMAAGWNILINATAMGIVAGKQRQAEIDNQKMMQQAERQAQMDRLKAQNKQKAEAFNKMQNSSYRTSDGQQAHNTQNSYNDLLTSDGAWNTQVQMWVQQYGVEKTREIVKQKKTNDYQQSIQTNNNYSQNQSNNGNIISAVTSNRQQIKIKVQGNVIIAYSNGIDQVGKQNWVSVVPNAGISKTGAGSLYSSGNLSKEFSYTASLNGMQIYFDM